jgi:hypothetical protein
VYFFTAPIILTAPVVLFLSIAIVLAGRTA